MQGSWKTASLDCWVISGCFTKVYSARIIMMDVRQHHWRLLWCKLIVFYFIRYSGTTKTLCLSLEHISKRVVGNFRQSLHFWNIMATFSSFTPTSSTAPLRSLEFLVRKKHRQKGLWMQSIVRAYLLWCLGIPYAICHSCESAWPDLFLRTRHLVQENLWNSPWASHRHVLYLSCEHLHILAPFSH